MDIPKGLGWGITVSDFVDEFNGLLKLTKEEFERSKLEYPKHLKKVRVLLNYGIESRNLLSKWKIQLNCKSRLLVELCGQIK